MDKVRIGVIGLGWFGETHVDTYQGVHGAEVTAVCTRRPERRAEIAEKYGVAKTYADYNDLLADPDIDAVSITTHAKDHLVTIPPCIKITIKQITWSNSGIFKRGCLNICNALNVFAN